MISNLAQRIATILVLLPLTIWILMLGSPYVDVLATLLTVGLLWEAFQLSKGWRWPLICASLTYVLLGMVGLILTWQESPMSLLWILVIIWSSDIGAYITGRLIGGPKLAPRISPKKTWSGFFGGTLCGMAGGLITAGYLDLPSKIVNSSILFALAIAFIGHMGDLIESAMKRKSNIKDSGSLLPGHGGLFDRLDSLILVGVALALFMAIDKVAYLTLG